MPTMNHITTLTAAAAIILFTGCQKSAQETTTTSNTALKVELLFEHDGVKVYRFFDGRWIYYTDARGAAEWTEQRPKSGSTTHRVETVQ